ncbi:hypothetical protein CH375_10600 [Leptospira ellisii]|uniref:Uncharacterized protein n=1 Tax=Leptospira ellisii TaxID=2023197 RepID=A0A2N0B8G5_9LEPT|nr:hypothetical protein CH379_11350 [Leptospira ellisii]PKA04494.1 hypothetical protein CH375_10600 [Leptospira ellisii]
MIKYLSTIFVAVLNLYCVSPDSDRQLLVIDRDTSLQNRWDIIENYDISNTVFEGKIRLLKSDSDFVDLLLSNYVVDNDRSALIHLSQNYAVALIKIENKTNQTQIFDTQNLNVSWNGKTVSPLNPEQYPKKIHCLNWKGNIKNFYNFIAISLVTAYTINAMFACTEGKCKEMEYMDRWLKENHPIYNKEKHFFSDAIFKTTLDFNQKLNLKHVEIEPNTRIQGIALYRNPERFADVRNFLTVGNCVVD